MMQAAPKRYKENSRLLHEERQGEQGAGKEIEEVSSSPAHKAGISRPAMAQKSQNGSRVPRNRARKDQAKKGIGTSGNQACQGAHGFFAYFINQDDGEAVGRQRPEVDARSTLPGQRHEEGVHENVPGSFMLYAME